MPAASPPSSASKLLGDGTLGHLQRQLTRFSKIEFSGTQIGDRKSTRLNSSHGYISYAVFCLKKTKHQVGGSSYQQDTNNYRLYPYIIQLLMITPLTPLTYV